MNKYRDLLTLANRNGIEVFEGKLYSYSNSVYFINRNRKIILIRDQDEFEEMANELSSILKKIV